MRLIRIVTIRINNYRIESVLEKANSGVREIFLIVYEFNTSYSTPVKWNTPPSTP